MRGGTVVVVVVGGGGGGEFKYFERGYDCQHQYCNTDTNILLIAPTTVILRQRQVLIAAIPLRTELVPVLFVVLEY